MTDTKDKAMTGLSRRPAYWTHDDEAVSEPYLIALKKRLLDRVTIVNGCWVYTGSLNVKGYGRIKVRGITTSTHRVSYELHKGPIPKGLWVLHKCDNPPCINPEHLFVGTADDNNQDMINKGRFRISENSPIGPRALSEEDVLEIRRLLAKGFSQRIIAEQFSVNQPTISFINTGRTWSGLK